MIVAITKHNIQKISTYPVNDNKIKLDTTRRVSSRTEAPDRKNFKANILRIYELLTGGEISQALKNIRT